MATVNIIVLDIDTKATNAKHKNIESEYMIESLAIKHFHYIPTIGYFNIQ